KSCDGLAMALRAGLALRDMEMVQFHPTGLLAGAHTRMTGTVIEEGLRGAGGYLLDGNRERFMHKYDAKLERATRDIVSRAMYSEIRAGRTTPHGGLYISMAHLGPANVRKQFKGMVERCADSGFDLAGGLVEVVPTAHYMMGGVEFNLDCTTALPGLFTAGEDSGGVHGANRLGGNGVANSTVFGGVAGEVMAAWLKGESGMRDPDRGAIDAAVARCERPLRAKAASHGEIEGLREGLFDLMWDKVGISREAAPLGEALSALDGIDAELDACTLADHQRAYSLSWHDWMNLKSLVQVSRVITEAALAREDSRGAHFRADFPEAGPLETSAYTSVTMGAGGKLGIAMKPVAFTRVKPGQTLIRDAA
ncbi:MAG: FAD-binding protein, partial [Betaproteobacteria bacterium]